MVAMALVAPASEAALVIGLAYSWVNSNVAMHALLLAVVTCGTLSSFG